MHAHHQDGRPLAASEGDGPDVRIVGQVVKEKGLPGVEIVPLEGQPALGDPASVQVADADRAVRWSVTWLLMRLVSPLTIDAPRSSEIR